MTVRVGVTGSREGVDDRQVAQLREMLAGLFTVGAQLDGMSMELHHGDCVGVDEAAAVIAQDLGWGPPSHRIVAHPPIENRWRAFAPAHLTLPADRFLARDRTIVRSVELLIAVPNRRISVDGRWQPGEGGTRYTVLFAREQGIPVSVIWPGGLVEGLR